MPTNQRYLKRLINKPAFRIIILQAGVFFVIKGITRGESAAVLRKAINICLECIGIG
ncbi:MAG: CD1871A family CXXC motif-containing protein [Clostridia bacterium]|nr:CD1871A family CXXC motif-containing protein [Clostridia bacterium]